MYTDECTKFQRCTGKVAHVSAFTVHYVLAQCLVEWTGECTDNLHCTCIVIHAHLVCMCNTLCTPLLHTGEHNVRLDDVLHAWDASHLCLVHKQCSAVRKNCRVFYEISKTFATFSHSNTEIAQTIPVRGTLWKINIFRYRNIPLQCTTLRVVTYELTDGHAHGCFVV